MNNDNLSNIKCLIFRFREDYTKYKLIKFTNRDVAKRYYDVALRKQNFVHAETFDECIKWLKNKNYKFEIVVRDQYNIHD